MHSQDILDRLFEVERQADSLAAEAGAEADRRVAAAKERARLAVAAAVESATASATAARAASAAEAKGEYSRALDSYRREIDGLSLDEAAFISVCERIVAGSLR